MSIATLDHDRFAAEARCEDVDSDEALLHAFVTSRDDLAFTKLVTRHASLVMGVCRGALGNEQDAEDAFQATFLVLARKASSLRSAKSLPAWLHKTAHRISLRARANKARRCEQSLEVESMVEDHSTLQRIATDHERSALDEELNRLPDRFRLPLFLCCLEGKSREEAARQLGWSSGSLKGRLERARQLLRRRLILRGVSLSVAVALVTRSQSVAHAAVSPDVIASTVQAGMRYAAGQSPVGYVSPNAHLLANWSLQVMSITSAKFVACAVLVIGALTLGNNWTVMPVAAEGNGSNTIAVEPTNAARPVLTFVALLDDEREDGEEREERKERESDRREGAEGREREQPRREGEPRKEAEGQRREVDRPREGEARREGDRPREAGEPREGGPRREEFRPKTDNEELLYKMILQLRREVAELRNALQSRGGDVRREGSERDQPRREGDQPRREGDQPRRDGDQPRGVGDRPRERDGQRAAPAREGERRDSDKP